MERFVVKDPMTGAFREDVPHYTIKEVCEETGFHHQTIRKKIQDGLVESQVFNKKHYVPQLVLDQLRAESPKARNRVGIIGIKSSGVVSEEDIKNLL